MDILIGFNCKVCKVFCEKRKGTLLSLLTFSICALQLKMIAYQRYSNINIIKL